MNLKCIPSCLLITLRRLPGRSFHALVAGLSFDRRWINIFETL